MAKQGCKRFKTVADLKKVVDGYFVSDMPWSVTGLCLHLHVCRDTLAEWVKTWDKPKSDVLTEAKNKIFESQLARGLTKEYSEGLVKFLAMNNHGFRSEKHQVLTVELPPINFNG